MTIMWKKIILAGAMVLSGLSLRAQTIDFTGITIRTERVVCERRNFVMLTGGADLDFDVMATSFGVRIGAYRRVGLYANLEMGAGGFYSASDENWVDEYDISHYMWTKRKDPRTTISLGGIFRVSKSVNFYLGGGIDCRTLLLQSQDGVWHTCNYYDGEEIAAMFEAGIHYCVPKFTFMLGAEVVPDHESVKLVLGVGYNF